ncbi:MAG: [FeFe] hydrogenase H-cluster radical SAM maturase HydE, partial [Candidatus Omnitrophica bacterium]|nr:[FeFe] hydrogenase H-cluster radical SAM maturase HydE [Candidatus Omnitrophota bacterium]
AVRRSSCGNEVLLRGIIEFSNHCVRNCLYCGLRRDNKKLSRFRMAPVEIRMTAERIVRSGITTVILQSGDDPGFKTEALCRLIQELKRRFPGLAITLSVGERPLADYKKFKEAGADRYLLKHEAANPKLYARLHPGQTLTKRMRILRYLKKLGYEVGAGTIVGLPGQTMEDLAKDIIFMKKLGVEMAGIGPFVPQKDTPLAGFPAGSSELTRRVIALTRLALPRVNLPATTALATVDKSRGQIKALQSGANVLMCNFTPAQYCRSYRIYDDKVRVSLQEARRVIRAAGRKAVFLTLSK